MKTNLTNQNTFLAVAVAAGILTARVLNALAAMPADARNLARIAVSAMAKVSMWQASRAKQGVVADPAKKVVDAAAEEAAEEDS